MKKTGFYASYTSMNDKLLMLYLIQIAKKIIKGAIYLDVDIYGDVNRFDFHGFYLNLMSGAGRLTEKEANPEEAENGSFLYECHVTSSPSSIGCWYHIATDPSQEGESSHPAELDAAGRALYRSE